MAWLLRGETLLVAESKSRGVEGVPPRKLNQGSIKVPDRVASNSAKGRVNIRTAIYILHAHPESHPSFQFQTSKLYFLFSNSSILQPINRLSSHG